MKGKKLLSVILAALLLIGAFGTGALAADDSLPLSAGLEALQKQFKKGVGPETNGYTIDYRYFTPANVENGDKYPLVIWLHGMSEGAYEGKQVIQNNIAYWTSKEFQDRFSGSHGAYILAPRSLEEKNIFWDDSMIEPLRALIEDFIKTHSDSVDTTRIYIGGFSMGGKMTLKMAVAYPEMFAAAFPICPAWRPADRYFGYLSEMPIWLTSGLPDPLVNYYATVTPTWNGICKASKVKENCRFSTLTSVRYPDGTKTLSDHHAWFAVNYDMFSIENGDYPYMKTVDGNGNTVTLTYPNGMISWLSGFTSDYDGAAADGMGNFEGEEPAPDYFTIGGILQIFEKILDAAQMILDMLGID